jgi:60 kDa SS-A/Ro ribonucleoprotein
MSYAKHFSTLSTPQTEPARADQVKNSAGGYAFAVTPWDALDRFLILGAEGGSFYASEKQLTVQNAKNVIECLKLDGPRAVARIAEVSDRGLAPKNDAAIFALAIACGADDPATRAAALAAIPKVCRIGTHLFHFVRDVESFRRWGRSLRTAVAAWYTDRPADKLAVQLVKYRQRDGWSHRDVMRLSHPKAPTHATLFRYALGAELSARTVKRGDASTTYDAVGELSPFVAAFEEAQRTDSKARICALIREHGLTHEMLPTQWKNHVEVWEALLERMPLTAMVRNLGKMTQIGLVKSLSAASRTIAERLGDVSAIRKARLHPLALLVALKVYERGHGEKGSLTWSPDRAIVDALDGAFYLGFDAIAPTGKNILLALDVSGSMGHPEIAGMTGITPRVGSAAMAMITARTEKNWHCFGFSNRFVPLSISPRQRLDDVIRTISNLPFDSTDCSVPMVYANQHKLDVDAFVVFTDSETFAGRPHPHQALVDYRRAMNKPQAKLIVVGMVSNAFTIADPNDAGMLDVVGFSTDVPAVMANFIRGATPEGLPSADE